MVTVEVELGEETVRALSDEAARFGFEGSEPYLRWLVEHRAVALRDADTEAVRERLLDLEARLARLEGDAGSNGTDGTGENVRKAIDDLLATTEAADDDEVEAAVATIEGTVEDVTR